VNALRLALAYLASRPLLTALHVAMIAVGVATLVLLVLFTRQAEDRVAADARPVDLVVGAKGSPLQLILSSVLHADVPTGNIPYREAKRVAANPMVASAVPLALGDSYRGHRIVGTTPAYLDLYGAKLAAGRMFEREMEAVVGHEVARRGVAALGARFSGSHGLAASGPTHEGAAYEVVGVLAPTGTVLDRLVVTPLASVWHVHEAHHGGGGEAHAHEHDEDAQDITAMLLRYRTPLAAATLPRTVNASTALQAASPAYENARLMNLVGVGVDAVRVFAALLMAIAAISVFVGLSSALQERGRDLALLRMLGARPGALVALTVAEGMTLVVTGVILGFGLGHGATEALGRWLARTQSWSVTGWAWQPAEAGIAAAVLAGGLVTCLLPALQAYRRDPALLLRR
jgi:putative ABC transport system permease protein